MRHNAQTLLQPYELPGGLKLDNRIVMAPMTHLSSHADGTISDAELDYYALRAAGPGMVITAATWVLPNGGLPGGPGADDDDKIPGLRRLAAAIQDRGAKAVLQLFHSGRQATRTGDLVAPSAIPETREGAETPRPLEEEEIEGIIRAFGAAARRAISAGFDGVEIHGANGNLTHQFFSPHANRRQDRFGGTLERRMTFGLSVVDEVKRVVRERANKPFIVGFRLSPEERETPGITMDDALAFADELAARGLDYLHVSLMDFRNPPRSGSGDGRSRLAILQERVGQRVPLIGVGAVRTAEDAQGAMEIGIPLLALGRELLLEPDWANKVRDGRSGEIRTSLTASDRERLGIPEPMWRLLRSIPGWMPFEDE
ncbi:oxidoreductase [Cohnella nanjingensis]|uniref:NADH-dependent flavin oxidoreductase n=1 Tax=Cohnella nanjingensis TaxID=1387779 RepID=A0A7X0RWW3_9BACL|nr:NADH-dependent flavin oxidoreductase [Cohnella nanjingensis]MBB6675118.1 NADH-dependent flavin oxidoreductase [Cohnella nanjingensis]